MPVLIHNANEIKGGDDQQPTQRLPPPGPPIPNQPPSHGQGDGGGRKKSSRLDIARFVVEIITLVVLFWYAVTTHRQWREMRRSVKASQKSAEAARDMLTETKKSFRLDQRPWVGLDQIDIVDKPTAGSVFRIKVSLRNSGKSPALHSDPKGALSLIMFVEGDERVPPVDRVFFASCGRKLQWDQTPSGVLILPEVKGISLSLSTPILAEQVVEKIMKNGGRISSQERKELEGARVEGLMIKSVPPGYKEDSGAMWAVRIFFTGCVDYFDQFHESHQTSFCLYYSPILPSGFSPCKKGNEAD